MSQFPPPPAPGVQPPMGYPQQPPQGNGKAVASLVLGICAVPTACLPIIGLPVAIVGIVLGVKSKNGAGSGMAIAGIILSIIGLVLTIANAAFGVYLALSGQHPMVK